MNIREACFGNMLDHCCCEPWLCAGRVDGVGTPSWGEGLGKGMCICLLGQVLTNLRRMEQLIAMGQAYSGNEQGLTGDKGGWIGLYSG